MREGDTTFFRLGERPGTVSPRVRSRFADERAVSPVIGAVVLVAITVLLSAVGAVLFFELAESPQPAPETSVAVSADAGTDTVTLELTAADTVTEDNTGKLVVVVDGENGEARKTWATEGGGVVDLNSATLGAGKQVTIDDASGPDTGDLTVPFELREDDTIRLVWHAPDDDRTATLATKAVPDITGTVFGPFDQDGAVVTVPGGAAGDGGAGVDTGPSGAQALGNTADVDGDSRVELPFVDGSGRLKLNDSSGQIQTLVDPSTAPTVQEPDTDKTLMASGTWDGSPPAVFYANAGHTRLYRVSSGGSPTLVADVSGNGANSVLGPGDIDGDGTDELVYADGSQEIRYVEPGGATGTTGFTSGSSTGIGNGPLVDFDGDGTDSAVVVDGSNDVRLVEAGGATSRPAQSSVDAAKSPATAADVDDDGTMEIVYVEASSSTLRYIDDVGGSPTVDTLRDDSGNPVSADMDTGVVS
jgi:flagellin-like protein